MKISKKKKGASIILVMAITMAVLIFSSVAISSVINTSRGNEIQVKEDDLFYIAESGFEHGYAKLMNEGSEASYSKRLDGANIDIDITKESERMYRIRSEAKKDNKSKVVQGVVEDTREFSAPVRYSEIISKYVVNSKGVNVGIEGSVTLQYVNSKTEIVKNDMVQVSVFDQPNYNPEDKLFILPQLKLRHENKITFNSMKDLIEAGKGNIDDLKNNSVVTEVHSIEGIPYNIVFINSDIVELNIPSGGEILQNIIILSSGDIKINNNNDNNVLYANISIICDEMIISNEGHGSINMSPQPSIFYEEQKAELDAVINKYLEPRAPSGGGSIDDWIVKEMSY